MLVHNSKSGNERKQCPFYNELEKCYGYKPNVKPVFMLGSNPGNVVENTEDVPKEESTLFDGDDAPRKKKPKTVK